VGWRRRFDPEGVRNAFGKINVAPVLDEKFPVPAAEAYESFQDKKWLVLQMMDMERRTETRRGQLVKQRVNSAGVFAGRFDRH
jgi:hypothetical protein